MAAIDLDAIEKTTETRVVVDSLLQNEVSPSEVNTNERYDLVRDTVEMFDAVADR